MISFTLNTRALSVNKAWRGGARYRSKFYLEFEKEVLYSFPKNKHIDGEVEIHYVFYLKKNFTRTDVSNLVKVVEDCMVRADLIEDDSKVIYFTARKVKAEKDSIDIVIKSFIS